MRTLSWAAEVVWIRLKKLGETENNLGGFMEAIDTVSETGSQ